VNVRFGDVGNGEVIGGGRRRIDVRVAMWVDHNRVAARRAPDQITRLRERWFEKTTDDQSL
jgi:hypothetical protein